MTYSLKWLFYFYRICLKLLQTTNVIILYSTFNIKILSPRTWCKKNFPVIELHTTNKFLRLVQDIMNYNFKNVLLNG